MKAVAEFHTYRMFEYERELAARELESFGVNVLDVSERGFQIAAADETELDRIVRRGTYFRALCTDAGERLTTAHHLELLHRQRGGSFKRQPTRFLSHGLHEYRGKFNPQLAQSLLNILDTAEGTRVVDPFMGSGTTGVVAATMGLAFSGSDLNPLAVEISRAKLRLANPAFAKRLLAALPGIRNRLERAAANNILHNLWDERTAEVLAGWFPAETLAALSNVRMAIDAEPAGMHTVLNVTLSSVVRDVSLQDPRDLRIRKRPDSDLPDNLDVAFPKAIDRLEDAARETAASGPHLPTKPFPRASIQLGSAADFIRKVSTDDARLVTSPPYATGLPYVDTDRLSLLVLGLVPSSELRAVERMLTGNRELSCTRLLEAEQETSHNTARLPDSVLAVIETVTEMHRDERAGFRRRAVAPLLYRYFADMGDVFASIAANTGIQRAVFVVGENTTSSVDGDDYRIKTPDLLADVAESRGLTCNEVLPLETWPRYDVHSANSIKVESAILLEQ